MSHERRGQAGLDEHLEQLGQATGLRFDAEAPRVEAERTDLYLSLSGPPDGTDWRRPVLEEFSPQEHLVCDL
jgi:hypothetical protein